MSTPRGTLSWLGAVVLTAVVTWLVHRHVPADGGAPRVRLLFRADVDAIESLRIDHGELQVSCERRDGVWWITDPITARADPESIRALLDTLALAPVHDAITLDEQRRRGVSHREYGLIPPRASLTVQGPTVPPTEIRIGAHAPHGHSLYTALSESPTVWVSDPALQTALPTSLTDLRDRTLLPYAAERLQRFELLIPDRPPIAAERDAAGRWWLRQPAVRRADARAVDELLDYVAHARIREFVRKPGPAGDAGNESADLSIAFGFRPDEAQAMARFWFSATRGPPVFHELIFGKTATDAPEQVYVHSTEEHLVATVDRTLVQALRISPERIRDRRLWSFDARSVRELRIQGDAGLITLAAAPDLPTGWMLTAPVQAPASERAAALIATLAELSDLAIADGATDTRPTLRLEWTVETPQRLYTALVSRGVADDSESIPDWYWHIPAEGWTHRVRGADLPLDFGSTAFYAGLRDPTLLDLPAHRLQRVEQQFTGGGQHAIVRLRDGGWSTADSSGEVADPEAVEALLQQLNPLRASRVAALAPTADNGFPTSPPTLTLTLTPRDPEQSVRILHVAGSAPGDGESVDTGGRLATLQGTDSVFVLSENSARILLRPLVRTLP